MLGLQNSSEVLSFSCFLEPYLFLQRLICGKKEIARVHHTNVGLHFFLGWFGGLWGEAGTIK